jgi:hypothetical protein
MLRRAETGENRWKQMNKRLSWQDDADEGDGDEGDGDDEAAATEEEPQDA